MHLNILIKLKDIPKNKTSFEALEALFFDLKKGQLKNDISRRGKKNPIYPLH